jgi:Methyltransferase domain
MFVNKIRSFLRNMNTPPSSGFGDPDLDKFISTYKKRYDLPALIPDGGIALELGVAEGGFSEAILAGGRVAHLYSVDMYAGDRGHDVEQYKRAFLRLNKYRDRNSLLKLTFDEALSLFPDNYFDFIYVDGYAHNGEDGGITLEQYFPKLKVGGIFAGDDYISDWPLVVEAVDNFVHKHEQNLYIFRCHVGDDWASKSPSWIIRKR